MLYPIGIQNFEDLRRNEFVYVDKTHHIHRLVSTGKYYFLSRPRRFGKSLLVSTMEAYFKGKKELFEGLALEYLEKDWTEYPVLHLDLNSGRYMEPKDLDVVLQQHLNNWETKYGVTPKYEDFAARLNDIIDAATEKAGRQIVVLVDEYDKPIVNNLGNEALSDYYRKTLQGFYGVFKAKDGQIRFGFLTGVSKIGKLSVFSTLNNLTDVSLNADYADICGISENELREYFDILNTFYAKQFREYWFETGTPTLLVNVMKQTSFDVTTLSDRVVVTTDDLNGMQDIISRPVSLFFQTGYLTIKDYDKEFQEYTLGFPNDEVKNGFLRFIYSYYNFSGNM